MGLVYEQRACGHYTEMDSYNGLQPHLGVALKDDERKFSQWAELWAVIWLSI